MSAYSGPEIVEDGLVLLLDAGNTKSYPGTGTVWFDLSGNGNNFNVLASAWNQSGYFNFGGSFGYAKNSADIPLSGEVTYCVLTLPLNSTSQWRTLTRSYSADHHVIIQSGGWLIGMYDNNGGAFINSGYSQQSLPGYATQNFDFMTWRWSNSDNPTYDLNVNGIQRATIVNSNARYNRGFGSIGCYHNGSTNPATGSQPWGNIAYFAAYNRRLSDPEVQQNFNAIKGRYGV